MTPFGNKTYDRLKVIALIWLPAMAALYIGIATLWGLGHIPQVAGSISVLDTFLGTILGISTSNYKAPTDGRLVVDQSHPLKDTYSLELTTALEDLAGKNSITLQVTPMTPATSLRAVPPASS